MTPYHLSGPLRRRRRDERIAALLKPPPGNPHDGHTLAQIIPDMEKTTPGSSPGANSIVRIFTESPGKKIFRIVRESGYICF